ncbi:MULTISPECIES: hypothetical protein [unclassified Rickettsia]|uniref:hypothetical protein n=1 Tax=unclassified Rickettsia TaxID=114295 RepID=UPI0031332A87
MARKLIKNPSLRSHEVAAAIQAIPNVMRDLIRILNKFSIKICLTGLPRRHKCLLAMTILVAMQQRPLGAESRLFIVMLNLFQHLIIDPEINSG